jgi:hypothetical protein
MDRNDFSTTTSAQQFLIGVDENKKVVVHLYKDSDSTSKKELKSATALTDDTWVYLAVTAELKANHKDTTLKIYLNNAAADASDDATSIFNVNKSTYKSYIGLERVGKAGDPVTDFEYKKMWNGFVFDLHLYQELHTEAKKVHWDNPAHF